MLQEYLILIINQDLKETEDGDAIINACLRQATLKQVLALPRPNPRVVANQ